VTDDISYTILFVNSLVY